ncbi:MAG TPA: hypothetical protein DCL40_06175 [Coxiellaceae bacterium]|nr:hypothetical protein [Coxiellaceae bacterium]
MKKIDSNTRLAIIILILMCLAAWLYHKSSQTTFSGSAANCQNYGSLNITDQKNQRSPWCIDGNSSRGSHPHIRYN